MRVSVTRKIIRKTMGKVTEKTTKPVVPTTQAAPETLPAAPSTPANMVVKLKDRPVLTLPAFRKKAAAS